MAPVAVVEAANAQDVVTAVRFAQAHDLEVAVQCTGHGAWASGAPFLLVHTGLLAELSIDPQGASARVGAGVRWQQVLDAAAPYGLGALCGSAPDVGVVGYLTGGGLSPVARTFGYGSDLVTAFEVVTGDGELRRATATENPSLFWGLRGGKGTLGIVTAVEFGLLPVGELFGGALYFDGADAAIIVRAWRDWCQTLPRQASTSLAVLRLPAMPMVPPPLAGRCTVAVRFAWIGDAAEGTAVLAPMQDVADVILGGTGVMPFAAVGALHADPVEPMPVHERSMLLRELPPEAVEALLDVAGPEAECPQLLVELRLLGGAIADEPAEGSAVCHRDAAFTLASIGIAAPPVIEATKAHSAHVMSVMEPWGNGAVQRNFVASGDPAIVARCYDEATLTRLATIAAAYDPYGRIAGARAVRTACATR
jgi:FAD/FMN-containing dehydrogenase